MNIFCLNSITICHTLNKKSLNINIMSLNNNIQTLNLFILKLNNNINPIYNNIKRILCINHSLPIKPFLQGYCISDKLV